MPQSSLRDIEKTLTSLWMNRDARAEFLDSGKCDLDATLAAQIDRDGVELYAGLLNYGHHDVMLSIYPLCAKLLSSHWEEVIDNYLDVFPPSHFNLNQTAKQFPEYVTNHLQEFTAKYPYLSELADYEWIELELLEHHASTVSPSELEILQTPEHFAQFGPILNPALIIRKYQHPIIAIAEKLEGPKRKPGKVSPKQTHVVVYRDCENNRCRFL